jgi:hypothetical protein
MRAWWSRLCRTLAGRQALADDLAAEIEAHVDLAAAENADRGMSPAAARDAARRRFGNVTLIRERARDRLLCADAISWRTAWPRLRAAQPAPLPHVDRFVPCGRASQASEGGRFC